MSDTITYDVPGVHCGHCKSAIEEEVGSVAGVQSVVVDLDKKQVTIEGQGLEEEALKSAISEAGYEAN